MSSDLHPAQQGISKQQIVESAEKIAHRICRDAIQVGRTSTWVGLFAARRNGTPIIASRTLEGDLYGGTAGIAYFLSEIYAITNDKIIREIAASAMRFSLESICATDSLGLYSGKLGVALASAICGKLCNIPQFVVEASKLAQCASAEIENTSSVDVIDGLAGVILGLLVLEMQLGTDWREEMLSAVRRLAQLAIKGRVWTWPTAVGSGPWLTGFAHGSSGLAYALSEAAKRTGQAMPFKLAAHAIAFEDMHFLPERGNWMDLRVPGRQAFGLAWCHGAPGILLSRLTNIWHSRTARTLRDIRAGVLATSCEVQRLLTTDPSDFSLCHGLSGLGTILAFAIRCGVGLEQECIEYLVAQKILEWQRTFAAIPTGLGRLEETPQLMTGTSGVGHALLQFSGLSVAPWILLPTVNFGACALRDGEFVSDPTQ